jgi:hypothetical protein
VRSVDGIGTKPQAPLEPAKLEIRLLRTFGHDDIGGELTVNQALRVDNAQGHGHAADILPKERSGADGRQILQPMVPIDPALLG